MNNNSNNNPNDFYEQIFGTPQANAQPTTIIKRKLVRRNGVDSLMYEVIQKLTMGQDGNPQLLIEERHGVLDDGAPFEVKIGFTTCSQGHIVHPGNIGFCPQCGRKYCVKCWDSECSVCHVDLQFQSLGALTDGHSKQLR
ncbi:MAG: hypothetical protein LHV68_09975 [Elusimicrobia bacterium]|nr:hypothetical protein [Candidatus Liberimonas magnetica]